MAVLTPTRVELKEVLFTTDFSPLSRAALPFAVALAQRYEAKVHMLHVLLPIGWKVAPDVMLPDTGQIAVAEAEQQMQAFVKGAKFDGVRYDYLVEEGTNVRREIVRLLNATRIDMLVMATHGREGVRQFFLGSVAEEVFRTVNCPVLTVSPRAAKRGPRRIRKILFATDLTPDSLNISGFVQGFAEDHEARLLVAHVPVGPRADTHAERVLLAESTRKWMREVIPPQPNLEYLVPFGAPAEAILNAAENQECDLIILGAHPAGVFSTHLPGAVAHKIVAEAYCPVLVLHH